VMIRKHFPKTFQDKEDSQKASKPMQVLEELLRQLRRRLPGGSLRQLRSSLAEEQKW
jgi:hypothetical protein